MIRSSACQPQADPFPALSGRHGDRRSYTTPWDTIRSQAEHKNRKTLYKALKAAVDAVRDADPAIFDTCNKLPNACSSGDEQAIIWALGVKETALAASEMLAEAVKPDELPPRRRGRQRNETYYAVAHEVALLFFEIMKMPPTYGFDNQKQDLVPKTEYSRALYEVCKVLNMTNFGSLKNAAKHTVDEFKSRPLNASAA